MKNDCYKIELFSLNCGDRFEFDGIEYILLVDFGRYRYAITANNEASADAEHYEKEMNGFKRRITNEKNKGVIEVCAIAEYMEELYQYGSTDSVDIIRRQKLDPWWIGEENNYMAYMENGIMRMLTESDKVVRGIRPVVLFSPETEVLYEYNV